MYWGLSYCFLREKTWNSALILQFNIQGQGLVAYWSKKIVYSEWSFLCPCFFLLLFVIVFWLVPPHHFENDHFLAALLWSQWITYFCPNLSISLELSWIFYPTSNWITLDRIFWHRAWGGKGIFAVRFKIDVFFYTLPGNQQHLWPQTLSEVQQTQKLTYNLELQICYIINIWTSWGMLKILILWVGPLQDFTSLLYLASKGRKNTCITQKSVSFNMDITRGLMLWVDWLNHQYVIRCILYIVHVSTPSEKYLWVIFSVPGCPPFHPPPLKHFKNCEWCPVVYTIVAVSKW